MRKVLPEQNGELLDMIKREPSSSLKVLLLTKLSSFSLYRAEKKKRSVQITKPLSYNETFPT